MEEWDQVKRVHVPDRNQELRRLDEAKEKAIVELKELHQKAEIEAGSSEAEIFEVHQMMLDEGEYIESIRNRIRTESVNAEYAATAAGEYFADMFRKMDNEYIKERAADILDITRRLVRVLSGEKQNRNIIQEPVISCSTEPVSKSYHFARQKHDLGICAKERVGQFSHCYSCKSNEYSCIDPGAFLR